MQVSTLAALSCLLSGVSLPLLSCWAALSASNRICLLSGVSLPFLSCSVGIPYTSRTSISSAVSVALALRSRSLLLRSLSVLQWLSLAFEFISHSTCSIATLQSTRYMYVTPPSTLYLYSMWKPSMRTARVEHVETKHAQKWRAVPWQTPSALKSQHQGSLPLAPITLPR